MNLRLEDSPFPLLARRTGAHYNADDDALLLGMLGQIYTIRRNGITLSGQKAPDSHEAIIFDYLGSAGHDLVETPWRSCGELGVQTLTEFHKRIEIPLAQHARDLIGRAGDFLALFDAVRSASLIGSDMAVTVRALPKVFLHIELSQESGEFPAEAWVLYSHNADSFLSMQGVQQLGELCKDRILSLLRIY